MSFVRCGANYRESQGGRGYLPNLCPMEAKITTRRVLDPGADVQSGRPETEVSLTRVGVVGVEKVIRVGGELVAESRRAHAL